MKQFLSSRQVDILVSALGIAAANQDMRDWTSRVLAGTKSKEPTTDAELLEVWRIIDRAVTVEVETFK